jgi:hypothetical protein
MLDGMPMVSAIFHVGEDVGSKLCHVTKHLHNNMQIFFNLNEVLSKIQKTIFLVSKSILQNFGQII